MSPTRRIYRHIVRKNVKLSLCLINYASCHEDMWGNGGITPFLTSALDRGYWSASRPQSFPYPLDRRLHGPQRRSGRCGEEKNLVPAVADTISVTKLCLIGRKKKQNVFIAVSNCTNLNTGSVVV
jgi:hypothetical protein